MSIISTDEYIHLKGKICSVPFAKFYFVPFVYSLKMPSDEGIKIWVGIGCDKGTSPINLHILTIPNSTPVVANKQHTRGRERQIDTERQRERQREIQTE